jgi:hypothetical protein
MRQTLPLSFAAIGFTGLSALAGAPAQALTYETILSPEVVGATGTGSAKLKIFEASDQMKLNIDFSGLSGNTTVAHIHGATATAGTGTAGVMTTTPSFLGFPAGVKSGSYEQTFNLLATSTYRAGFITNSGGTAAGARDAFLAALLDGKAYLNVHSQTFPGGEIRGFFAPAPTPVPGPLPLLGAAAAWGWSRRLRQRLASSSR